MTVMTDWREELENIGFHEWGNEKCDMCFIGSHSDHSLDWEKYRLLYYWHVIKVKAVGNVWKVTFCRERWFSVLREVEVYESLEAMLEEISIKKELLHNYKWVQKMNNR